MSLSKKVTGQSLVCCYKNTKTYSRKSYYKLHKLNKNKNKNIINKLLLNINIILIIILYLSILISILLHNYL